MASPQLAMHQSVSAATRWSFSYNDFFEAPVLIKRLRSLRRFTDHQYRESVNPGLLVGHDYRARESLCTKGAE
jgi:hypothetical protein